MASEEEVLRLGRKLEKAIDDPSVSIHYGTTFQAYFSFDELWTLI